MIKHGADISQGVLHELIVEYVRHPKKLDKLLDVYQTIVDNAINWRSLKEKTGFAIFNEGSDDYVERYRETMIWLLTHPLQNYDNKDALQCALDHGASAMFWHFITTRSVFRTDGEEAWKWLGIRDSEGQEEVVCANAEQLVGATGKNWNWTVFDVTNFTKETLTKSSSDPDPQTTGVADSSENTPLCVGHPTVGSAHLSSASQHNRDGENQQSPTVSEERNNTKNSHIIHHDFSKPHAPKEPYLDHLLTVFDRWRTSRILSIQPLKELTKPHIALVQRFYFFVGLLQLIYIHCLLHSVHLFPCPDVQHFEYKLQQRRNHEQ